MAGKKQKNQVKQLVDQNPIETFRGIGKGVAHSLSSDFAKSGINDLWKQLLGANESGPGTKENRGGDLSEGEELDLNSLSGKNKSELALQNAEPGIDYRREILHGDRMILQETTRGVEVKIQEIIIELRHLTSASKELATQFKQVSVEQLPVNVGKYHLNFFEWFLTEARKARMAVEDSASWLSVFQSKKGKKQYWNMFKKHGTSFGMSNERNVSTQTG